MKLYLKIIMITLIPLWGFGSWTFAKIQPIDLIVVDAETKQPLPNIVVYYRLESAGCRHFLGIPIPDPSVYTAVRTEKLVTDADGRICISKYHMWQRMYERPFSEMFTINMDLRVPPEKVNKDYFLTVTGFTFHLHDECIRPNEQYTGLIFLKFMLPKAEKALEIMNEKYVIAWDNAPRRKEKETITIELQRAPLKVDPSEMDQVVNGRHVLNVRTLKEGEYFPIKTKLGDGQ